MSIVITPPTSTLLMDPEEARQRLEAPLSEAAAIQKIVQRVSQIIASQLKFAPWYQEVEETFPSESCTTLNLENRPFVSVVSVADQDGNAAVENTDFEVILTGRKSGEAYLRKPDEWVITAAWAGALGAKWTVRLWSGWWLPTMAGSMPAGVRPLPDDLVEATWITTQFRYTADNTNPSIAEFAKGGARVTFRDRNAAAFPRGYSADLGGSGIPLPAEVMSILATYLPVVF